MSRWTITVEQLSTMDKKEKVTVVALTAPDTEPFAKCRMVCRNSQEVDDIVALYAAYATGRISG